MDTRVDYARARDEELVERLAARDDRALERLYEKYGRAVYSLVLRIVRDAACAEEIAQEVFLKLWRRPSGYVPSRGAFATWLLSVAHHRAIDQVRSRRFEGVPLDGTFADGREPIDQTADLADQAWLSQRRIAVRLALTTLPEAQRHAVELAYFGGLTQREIAERLGEPLGTVKTRIRLGMQKLKPSLLAVGSADGTVNGRAGGVWHPTPSTQTGSEVQHDVV